MMRPIYKGLPLLSKVSDWRHCRAIHLPKIPTRRTHSSRRHKGELRGSLFLAGALFLGASASWAGDGSMPSQSGGDTASGPLDAPTQAAVEQLVRHFQDTNHTPGVLVGIWSPKGTFVSATGVADLATGEPLSTDMQFKIASIQKTFVGTLILQLVGEGKVALDDHISKWMEGVPNGDQVTIRELLNHTSGLGNGLDLPEVIAKVPTGCTEDFLLAAGAKEPPVAAPGTVWSYSNYGYNLLGRVVELVTGQDLSAAIQQRITEPLGLHRTLLPTSGNGLSEPFTDGYSQGEVGFTQAPSASDDATDIPASCLWGHGGMVSTLADMRVWSQALATGALLKPEVWRQAKKDLTPYVFSGGYNGPGRWHYGLGFVVSGQFIGGEGSFQGYESVAMYSPALETTIEVVSTKQPNAITPPPMLQALAMAIYGPDIGFGLTPAQALEPNSGWVASASTGTTTPDTPPDLAPVSP
jgi:D-alanyl-D-alanine carboxypeptidase